MSNTISSILRGRCGVVAGALTIAIALGTPAKAAGQTVSPSSKVSAAAPCCTITAINLKTGVVTAVDPANMRFRFQLVLNDPPKGDETSVNKHLSIKLLRSLRVGQKIYANFDTKKVSIDGGIPCCVIVGTGTRP